MQLELEDARGIALHIGDHVIDDRGKVFVILATDATIARENQVRVHEVKGKTFGAPLYLPCGMIFRLNAYHSQAENRKLWRELYEHYVRPRSQAHIKERKAEFQERRKS